MIISLHHVSDWEGPNVPCGGVLREQTLTVGTGDLFNIRLTKGVRRATFRGFLPMSKVCQITGSRATRGSIIHRRGMAKKKGGVGRHVTKNVPRIFGPNLHEHRIWVPELKKYVRVKVTARGLKTINKNGAYKALKKAGAI